MKTDHHSAFIGKRAHPRRIFLGKPLNGCVAYHQCIDEALTRQLAHGVPTVQNHDIFLRRNAGVDKIL